MKTKDFLIDLLCMGLFFIGLGIILIWVGAL